jgi:hypothetical protein
MDLIQRRSQLSSAFVEVKVWEEPNNLIVLLVQEQLTSGLMSPGLREGESAG